MFIAGEISHPQNLTMEKLLAPKLIPIEECDPNNMTPVILVDTIPVNTGRASDIKFDVVLDHHVEMPVINGDNYLFINLHTGSCCGTIYSLIKYYDAAFEEDVDYDQQVATALMVGSTPILAGCWGTGSPKRS
jgi:nanoRNase/pAp phosphatase (c-di-AMP/oligoRNAs hydrolase)